MITPLEDAKSQARALRAALTKQDTEINHAQSLELIAQQNGARDWNTFHAKLGNLPPKSLTLNARVSGEYLGQAFVGTVVSLSNVGEGFDISLQLDQAVDVVEFDSFSNLRRRVRGTIDKNLKSLRHTSNGKPHLVIDRVL